MAVTSRPVVVLAICDGLSCSPFAAGVSAVDSSSEDRCIWCPLLYTGEARYVDGGPAGGEFWVIMCEMEGRPS